MTAAELLEQLLAAYRPHYPVRLADQARITGTGVTVVIAPDTLDYDVEAPCGTGGLVPFTLRVRLLAVAPATGETAVRDLVARSGGIAALARSAGFAVESWQASNVDEAPALLYIITAVGNE